MSDQDTLIAFIKAEEADGTPRNAIRDKLLSRGWSPIMVDQALASVRSGDYPSNGQSVPSQPQGAPRAARFADPLRVRRHRRAMARAVVYLLVFLAVAGVAGRFAYDRLFVNSANQIISRTMASLPAIGSLAYSADIKAEIPVAALAGLVEDSLVADGLSDSETDLRLAIGASGTFDWHDPSQTASTLAAAFRSVGWSERDFLSLEYRAARGQAFFRLSDGAGFSQPGLDRILNKWISYDSQAASSQLASGWIVGMGDYGSAGRQLVSFLAGLPQSGAIIEASRVGTGSVGPIGVWQLKIAVDGQRFRQELAQAFPASRDSDFFKAISVRNVELWVGQLDNLPYRLAFRASSLSDGRPVDLSVTLELNNFNEPVTVELPDSGLPLNQALQAIRSTARPNESDGN